MNPRLADTEADPVTSSFEVGVALPIPTLPALVITSWLVKELFEPSSRLPTESNLKSLEFVPAVRLPRPDNVKALDERMTPLTSRGDAGFNVPIPTFPTPFELIKTFPVVL